MENIIQSHRDPGSNTWGTTTRLQGLCERCTIPELKFLVYGKNVHLFGRILFVKRKKDWLWYFWSILRIRFLIASQTSMIFWFPAMLNLQCLRSGNALHLGSRSMITMMLSLFLNESIGTLTVHLHTFLFAFPLNKSLWMFSLLLNSLNKEIIINQITIYLPLYFSTHQNSSSIFYLPTYTLSLFILPLLKYVFF